MYYRLYSSVTFVASARRGGERKNMGADKVISPLLSSCPYLILSVSNIGFLIAGVSLIRSAIPSPPLPSPLVLILSYLLCNIVFLIAGVFLIPSTMYNPLPSPLLLSLSHLICLVI